ncbi:polysaccharide deacetylase family protein [Heyndrickxia sp. NPDC080065]|uniref:polysaccharide deacetylase family protein n=1 Tax=Heyndrickxia sp. NPDC080065 TaxID=3390568 RepID=UPI003D010132
MKYIIRLFIPIMVVFALSACVKNQTDHNKEPEKVVTNTSNDHQSKTIHQENQIIKMKELADKGEVENASTKLTQNFKYVQEKWGQPDKIDQVNNGFYAVYDEKKITYGYNNKNIIYDVRSYDKQLQNLDFKLIQKVLGKPYDQRKNNEENIVVYQVNKSYQLKFIIKQSTGKVDHISVYDQQWDQACCKQAEKTDYFLPIKGNSNQLSDFAWKNMMKWREDAVLLAKKHKEVSVNGPNVKKVALTFDDGPDNINTPEIINTLEKFHVKGNFFFIGERVKQYPEVVKQAYQNGNLVLSHSYFHDDLTKKNSAEMKKDLLDTEKAIEKIIGKKPAILRPPYGETNQSVISNASQLGYHIVLWSIDTLDWSQKDYENIVKNVVSNVRNGDIILMHSNDDKAETAKAVPIIIEELNKKGFEIVDLSELLSIQPYK